MHPRIFAAFDRVCRERGAGGDVLEIGATSAPDTLLRLPALARARSRAGVDLEGGTTCDGIPILRANTNDLSLFAAASFDTVLANSVLEHDPRFWLTLAEVRRVSRPGALVVLGVPAYAPGTSAPLLRRLARVPVAGALVRRAAGARLASTPTLVVHDFPGDYYRFSAQAMREVLLDGLDEREVTTLMSPPRVVGSGRAPVR